MQVTENVWHRNLPAAEYTKRFSIVPLSPLLPLVSCVCLCVAVSLLVCHEYIHGKNRSEKFSKRTWIKANTILFVEHQIWLSQPLNTHPSIAIHPSIVLCVYSNEFHSISWTIDVVVVVVAVMLFRCFDSHLGASTHWMSLKLIFRSRWSLMITEWSRCCRREEEEIKNLPQKSSRVVEHLFLRQNDIWTFGFCAAIPRSVYYSPLLWLYPFSSCVCLRTQRTFHIISTFSRPFALHTEFSVCLDFRLSRKHCNCCLLSTHRHTHSLHQFINI